MKLLNAKVFPSTDKTIKVQDDPDYGGAHKYEINNCLGFEDGETVYTKSTQTIQFVQKNVDGTVIAGLQSEQLVEALLDRTAKLNNKFPSDHNIKMMHGLEVFLEGCKERVQERIDRGVMGDLKK